MPSVMQTIRGTSASRASRMAAAGGRDVDDGGVRLDLSAGLLHGVKHRQAQVDLAALAGTHAAHHVGPVLDCLLRMEGPLLAGEALADDLGLLGQGHVGPSLGVACPHSPQPTPGLASGGNNSSKGSDGGSHVHRSVSVSLVEVNQAIFCLVV